MSSLITEQGSVHYEVFGRGRPVIRMVASFESDRRVGDVFHNHVLDDYAIGRGQGPFDR